MQLVTPSVVPLAVRIDTRICTINFHVSRFITRKTAYFTASCTTNPANMKPKMAVICDSVPFI